MNLFPLQWPTFVVFIYLPDPKDDFKLVGYRSHTLLLNSALVWARCRQKSITHVSPWNGWVLWMKIVDKKSYVGIRASTANRYGRQLADDWLKLNEWTGRREIHSASQDVRMDIFCWNESQGCQFHSFCVWIGNIIIYWLNIQIYKIKWILVETHLNELVQPVQQGYVGATIENDCVGKWNPW